MFILAELIQSIAHLISLICSILYFILVIRVILSWFQVNPYNDFVQIIYRITDPILAPFRRLPLQYGGLDFSPIVAFMAISILQNFLVRILLRISSMMV